MSPTVLSHPKISSTRLRRCWLTAYPGCRVVRPSIALRRFRVFCATCGVTPSRRLAGDEIPGVVAFVGPERDAPVPIQRPKQFERGGPLGVPAGRDHAATDGEPVAVFHQHVRSPRGAPHDGTPGNVTRAIDSASTAIGKPTP